jgi:hypothetical protein
MIARYGAALSNSIAAIDAPAAIAERPAPLSPGRFRRARPLRPIQSAIATDIRTTPATSSITCLTSPRGRGTNPSRALPGPIRRASPKTQVHSEEADRELCNARHAPAPGRHIQRGPDRAWSERIRKSNSDHHANSSEHLAHARQTDSAPRAGGWNRFGSDQGIVTADGLGGDGSRFRLTSEYPSPRSPDDSAYDSVDLRHHPNGMNHRCRGSSGAGGPTASLCVGKVALASDRDRPLAAAGACKSLL